MTTSNTETENTASGSQPTSNTERDSRPARADSLTLFKALHNLLGCIKCAADTHAYIAPGDLEPVSWESKPMTPGQGTILGSPELLVMVANKADPSHKWACKQLAQYTAPLIVDGKTLAEIIWRLERGARVGIMAVFDADVRKRLERHVQRGDIVIANDLPNHAKLLRELRDQLCYGLAEWNVPSATLIGRIECASSMYDICEAPLEKGDKCEDCGGEYVRPMTLRDIHDLQKWSNAPFGLSTSWAGKRYCPNCHWIEPGR